MKVKGMSCRYVEWGCKKQLHRAALSPRHKKVSKSVPWRQVDPRSSSSLFFFHWQSTDKGSVMYHKCTVIPLPPHTTHVHVQFWCQCLYYFAFLSFTSGKTWSPRCNSLVPFLVFFFFFFFDAGIWATIFWSNSTAIPSTTPHSCTLCKIMLCSVNGFM